MTESTPGAAPLTCFSIVIPARDEEGCIASTVQHLALELRLHQVPHEIIVVDDGSQDRTWDILQELQRTVPALNDTTNAFKAYRRTALDGLRPFLSPHFNLTVELPLKIIVRGYSWTVIPITWRNRRTGLAKLQLREMGTRYVFIVLYVWLEKYFSGGDYRKA